MSYAHITRKERFRIENLLSFEFSQKEIALDLRRSESTISYEISHNGGKRNYDAGKADKRKRSVRKQGKRASRKLVADKELADLVEAKLLLHWSPEQICGRQKILCHETIYQWIYKERKDLIPYLRRKKNKYRRRHGTKIRQKRREDAKKRRIDIRPRSVEKRSEVGHWEGDTIVGGEKNTAITTHVERVSGYLIADVLPLKRAESLAAMTVKSFECIARSKKKTVTYDNGLEFSSFEIIEKETGMIVYFAYPYHSWERGTNENTNGLLREFFPKRSPFATLKQRDVDCVVELINHRPRKRLGYLTPHEVFIEGRNST